MRMFKCDVCGTPFVYTNKQQCNFISFSNMDLDNHEKFLSPKQINLFYSYDQSCISASYSICPSCFEKIRNLLWSISDRKISET